MRQKLSVRRWRNFRPEKNQLEPLHISATLPKLSGPDHAILVGPFSTARKLLSSGYSRWFFFWIWKLRR